MDSSTAAREERTPKHTFTLTFQYGPGQGFHGYGAPAADFVIYRNDRVETSVPGEALSGDVFNVERLNKAFTDLQRMMRDTLKAGR